MKETRFFYVPDAAHATELPDDEAQHALRVLRLHEGDEIMLMDGKGNFYEAVICQPSGHHCRYSLTQQLAQPRQWQGYLHLAIAPTKMMERMEWLFEKATEVGVDEFSLLNCQFSERRVVKEQRLEKIVISAMKQSRKAWLPRVNGMTDFRRFIESHAHGHRYIAHCYDEVPRVNLFAELCKLSASDDALVLIGPEGDFSIAEVQAAVDAGFVSVDLGKSRLRTETAGLSAVMMMQLAKMKGKGESFTATFQ